MFESLEEVDKGMSNDSGLDECPVSRVESQTLHSSLPIHDTSIIQGGEVRHVWYVYDEK
jgi:hypothetical protein